MNMLPGWFPGGALAEIKPAEAFFGAVSSFTGLSNNLNISTTLQEEHASRWAYVLCIGVNANSSTTNTVTSVTFPGSTAATKLFELQSGAGHVTVWGASLPTGTSGTTTVSRSTGNGFSSARIAIFTVNYLRDPTTLLDVTDFVNDVAADPWSYNATTKRGGVVLGLGNGGDSPLTHAWTGLALDDIAYSASPNFLAASAAHVSDTPASSAFAITLDLSGAGNSQATIVSIR